MKENRRKRRINPEPSTNLEKVLEKIDLIEKIMNSTITFDKDVIRISNKGTYARS